MTDQKRRTPRARHTGTIFTTREEKAMNQYLDDDENVKAMRETARAIGLTELLVKASQSTNSGATKELVGKALHLLGEERTS